MLEISAQFLVVIFLNCLLSFGFCEDSEPENEKPLYFLSDEYIDHLNSLNLTWKVCFSKLIFFNLNFVFKMLGWKKL